jgi:hypothetical protein
MTPETKSILLRFDEIGQYETPSKFDYKTLQQRVIKLRDDLQKHFGLDFKIDDQVQDASFYCYIRIPTGLVIKPRKDTGYSISISNFGSLATINFMEEYSEETNSSIKNILKKHEFQFLDADEIDEPYDGRFEEFKKITPDSPPTWYVRYFDFL